MANRPGRRPHRKSQSPPSWVLQQRKAVAYYQRRHPKLDYNQIRQRADYKANWRTIGKRPYKSEAPGGWSKIGRRQYHSAATNYARINGKSYRETVSDPVFQKHWQTFTKQAKLYSKDPSLADRQPGGVWDEAMVAFGWRQPDNYWLIGETPTVRDEPRGRTDEQKERRNQRRRTKRAKQGKKPRAPRRRFVEGPGVLRQLELPFPTEFVQPRLL